MLLRPPPSALVTVAVARPNYDSRGNREDSRGNPLPAPNDDDGEDYNFTVQAVVSAQEAMTRPRLGEGQENRFIQDASIFVPRGTDIRPGDEITYNETKFVVAGHARGDQKHPFTGQSFGWMEFRMQGVG